MVTFGAQISSCLALAAVAAAAQPNLLSDIVKALQTAKDCASCHTILLPPVQAAARQGDKAFVDTFTAVCKKLKLADDDVCAGRFERLGPIIAHSLRAFDAKGTTATRFCDAAFGLCQPLPVVPYTVHFPKPLPKHPTKFTSKGGKPFQVVHMSDVHIDRHYTVGSDANCTKNICCRKFADHRGPITEPAGPFGNSGCDTPADLSNSMLHAISSGKLFPRAKFSIFTGDVVSGDTWIVDKKEATEDLVGWNTDMLHGLDMPVYPSPGNHDVDRVNSFPRNTTVTDLNSNWVFDIERDGWKPWIKAAGSNQVEHFSGSYSVVVPGTHLRILSVNTQYWYKQNFWLYDRNENIPDPNGILAFMVDQLQAAEDRSERVWIIGHIPSGKADIVHDQSNYYDQIVQRYKNTIAGQHRGHSHKDQIEIAYSDYHKQTAETADSIVFIGPAVTPTSGNPAFKVYDVDPDTYEVMDAKVYYTNTSDPHFQTNPTWKLYYSARESYGPLVGHLKATDSLSPAFWHKLTTVFAANDTAFQLFNTRISRGGAVTPCTGTCKDVTICDMRAARSENNCDVSTPGTKFKRSIQDGDVGEDDDVCGGEIRQMFSRIRV